MNLNEISEEFQIIEIEKNPYLIEQIENPSEFVQLAAVKTDGYVVLLIQNPSKKIQIEATKQNPYSCALLSEKIRCSHVNKEIKKENDRRFVGSTAKNLHEWYSEILNSFPEKHLMFYAKKVDNLLSYLKNPSEEIIFQIFKYYNMNGFPGPRTMIPSERLVNKAVFNIMWKGLYFNGWDDRSLYASKNSYWQLNDKITVNMNARYSFNLFREESLNNMMRILNITLDNY